MRSIHRIKGWLPARQSPAQTIADRPFHRIPCHRAPRHLAQIARRWQLQRTCLGGSRRSGGRVRCRSGRCVRWRCSGRICWHRCWTRAPLQYATPLPLIFVVQPIAQSPHLHLVRLAIRQPAKIVLSLRRHHRGEFSLARRPPAQPVASRPGHRIPCHRAPGCMMQIARRRQLQRTLRGGDRRCRGRARTQRQDRAPGSRSLVGHSIAQSSHLHCVSLPSCQPSERVLLLPSRHRGEFALSRRSPAQAIAARSLDRIPSHRAPRHMTQIARRRQRLRTRRRGTGAGCIRWRSCRHCHHAELRFRHTPETVLGGIRRPRQRPHLHRIADIV